MTGEIITVDEWVSSQRQDSGPTGVWWVAGYPKSGTTWVRHFISAYLWGHAELNGAIGISDTMPYLYQAVSPRPISQMDMKQMPLLRYAVIEHGRAFFSEKRLWLKTHHAMGHCHGIPLFNTEQFAGGIYVVRDPRDIAHSLADHTGITVDEAIEFMSQRKNLHNSDYPALYHAVSSWSHNVETWTRDAPGPLFVVTYEDMLERPLFWFKEMAAFIDRKNVDDIQQARIVEALKMCDFNRMQKLERAGNFNERSRHSERFFRFGKAGKYRELLEPLQIRAIEANHDEWMGKFGYYPEE